MKQVDTILLVDDIEVSKDFYAQTFGLEILHDWGSMVIFKNRLALHQVDLLKPEAFGQRFKAERKSQTGNVIIYIELDHEDIDVFYKRMYTLGLNIIHEVVALPWQRIFRIYDPDGHIIEIGEPQANL